MKTNGITETYENLIRNCGDADEILEVSLDFIENNLKGAAEPCLQIIESLLSKINEDKDKEKLAHLYYYQGRAFINTNKFMEGREALTKSLELFEASGDNVNAIRLYSALGRCCTLMGNASGAFEYFEMGNKLAENMGDQKAISTIFIEKAQSSLDLKQYEGAVDYLHKAFYPEMKMESKVSVLEKLGQAYHLLEQNKKAQCYLVEALELAKEEKLAYLEARILASLGASYKGLGEDDKAKEILQIAIEKAQKIALPEIEARAYLAIGEIALARDDIQEALAYFKKAVDIAKEIDISSLKIEALKYVAQIYEDMGEWQEAVGYFDEYHQEYQNYLNSEAAKEIDRIKMAEATKEADLFKQMYQQISTISLIGREITSSLDLKEVINTIYYKLNELMDTSVLSLGLFDEETKQLSFDYYLQEGEWVAPVTMSTENEDSLGAWCINNKKEIIIGNAKEEYSKYVKIDVEPSTGGEKKVFSIIYVPLTMGDKVIGTLSVQSYIQDAYNDYQVEIFKALASYVTIAVENAGLYKEVKTLATKDPLTNLSNRSHFNMLAEREFMRYKRTRDVFAVVMFDLDHFKKVNDQFGHDIGDIVLKSIADFFSERLRRTDIFGRYGGEEFLMLLPNTELEDAMTLIERFRDELSKYKIDLGNGQTYTITASFGISVVKPRDASMSDIIKRADNAVYESKRSGRNRTSYSI